MINFIKNKKYWIIGIVVILIIGGILIYQKVKSGKNQVQYTTAQAQKGTIISSISASGAILSSNYYAIATGASGIVKNVFVKDGDQVKIGQKLLEISLDQDGQQAQAKAYSAYLSAQSSLQTAENNKLTAQSTLDSTNYNRDKNLLAAKMAVKQAEIDLKNITSKSAKNQKNLALRAAQEALTFTQSQYDSQTDVIVAQNKLSDADNSISQAKINLQASWLAYQQTQAVVTSPINGTVSGLSCYSGMSIAQTNSSSSANANSSSDQLLAIFNESNPVVSVDVSESDINKIKTDQKVTITVDAITNKTFTGKVIGINKTGVVSSSVTNYPLTIQFDGQANDVLPNMGATANIILDSKTDVLTVPSVAVQTSTDGSVTVQILVNGVAENKTVQVGLSSDTDVEITSGLNEGDTVITGTVAKTTTTSTSTTSVFGGLRTGGNLGGSASFGGAGGASRARGGN